MYSNVSKIWKIKIGFLSLDVVLVVHNDISRSVNMKGWKFNFIGDNFNHQRHNNKLMNGF